jgi:phosphoglycolate phosphatase
MSSQQPQPVDQPHGLPTEPNRGPLADVRLVVYDLDGTLLDAFEDIRRCLNEALTGLGLEPLALARVKGAVGDGAAMLVRRCLGPDHADRFDEVFPRFMEFYSNNPTPTVRLYPGVLEALAAVRALGLFQAILSNKPQVVTDQSCEQLGLTGVVDGVWGARPDAPLKPHPESLLRIVRHFGVTPSQCAVVGDYRADYEVARAAGARMIGVTWGLWDRAQTEAQRPDAIIERMADLPGLFDQINSIS